MVTPVTSSNRDDRQLGDNDRTSDSRSDFLGNLDTETDVSVEITDGDESLESGSLTGRGLLLDGRDRHDFVLQRGQELVDDLELLDGQGEEVDFLHGLDLAVVDQSTELGDGNPTSGTLDYAIPLSLLRRAHPSLPSNSPRLVLILLGSSSSSSSSSSTSTSGGTSTESTSGSFRGSSRGRHLELLLW